MQKEHAGKSIVENVAVLCMAAEHCDFGDLLSKIMID